MVVVGPVVVHPAAFVWVGVLAGFGVAVAGACVAAGFDDAVVAPAGADLAATTCVLVL